MKPKQKQNNNLNNNLNTMNKKKNKPKQNKKNIEHFVYDRTIREIFQEIPTSFVKLLTNKEAIELLETKFPKVEEKQIDLLVKLNDNSLFHLELQLSDDIDMPQIECYTTLFNF